MREARPPSAWRRAGAPRRPQVEEEAREGVVEILVPASELADLEEQLQTEHDRLRKLARHLLQHGPKVQPLAQVAFSLAAHLHRLRKRVAGLRQ